MLVFLIGYMGSGKSSIGRPLARRLEMRFVDMDTEIENECGCPVGDVFATKGEAAFREIERSVLHRLAKEQNMIVATGGGSPCFFDNIEVMNRAGITIYLQVSTEKLTYRLATGRAKRPIIRDKTDQELLEFVQASTAEREPFYSRAKMTLCCDHLSDEYIANHIIMYIQNQ